MISPCQDLKIRELLHNPNLEPFTMPDGKLDYWWNDERMVSPPDIDKELDGELFDCDEEPMEHCSTNGHIEVVILDESLVIENGTFRDCRNIRSIELPKAVPIIGDEAFAGCVNLTDLAIPDTVKYIGKDAFRGVPHITYTGPLESENNWGALSRN